MRSSLPLTVAALVAVALAPSADARKLLFQVMKKYTARERACQACYRTCPVSCYVGTCGLNFGFAAKRFEETSQCYSCDPVAGAEKGDYVLCSGDEALAADTYTPVEEFKPLAPSDNDLNAMSVADELNKAAKGAMDNAQLASTEASKLVSAANAKFNAANQPNEADYKEAESLAARIKADAAQRALTMSEKAQQRVMADYNVQEERLRKEELVSEEIAKKLSAADKVVETSREAYTRAAQLAASAARDAAIAGSQVASSKQIKAEAQQMIAAARSAVKASAMATKNAKDAMHQATLANKIAKLQPLVKVLPPCKAASALLQVGGDEIKDGMAEECVEEAEEATTGAAVGAEEEEQQVPTPSGAVSEATTATPAAADATGAETVDVDQVDETVEVPEGPNATYLLTDDVSENMTRLLAGKLAENPNAVNDPATFDFASQAPGVQKLKAVMAPGVVDHSLTSGEA